MRSSIISCEKRTEPVYLEVRESNVAARELYRSAGFEEIGRCAEYYTEPAETAIVMKFYS